MIQLNHALLDDLGLGQLADDTKDSLLAHLYDKLELNVGTVIAQQLNDDQLDEFEKLIDDDKQEEALSWLQENYPDYKKVVEAELSKLKDDLKKNSDKIIEQSSEDNPE